MNRFLQSRAPLVSTPSPSGSSSAYVPNGLLENSGPDGASRGRRRFLLTNHSALLGARASIWEVGAVHTYMEGVAKELAVVVVVVVGEGAAGGGSGRDAACVPAG